MYPHAYVGNDLVVVDRDSEFADYDNPRGNIYGEAYYVVIEQQDGSRKRHNRTFVSKTRSGRAAEEARANQLCEAVNNHLRKGGKVNENLWTPISACYGSDAYIRNGDEQELIEWEREMDREDRFYAW